MIDASEVPFSLAYGDDDVRRVVTSRRALAKALGCSEATVSRMSIAPGNPGTLSNGAYPLQKWKVFYGEWNARNKVEDEFALSGGSSELKQEQLALMRAKRQKAELDLQARLGELVELAEIEQAAFSFASKLCAQHKRSATVDLFNRLCDAFPVDDAAALIQILEDFHDDLCRKTQEFSAGAK